MCGLRTVPAGNGGASYCRLQLVFTPLFTPPSGPPWKAHRGTFGLSRHPNELLVSNRCSCRYRHRYNRSAPTRFGHSRNFFFKPPWGPMLVSSGAVGGVENKVPGIGYCTTSADFSELFTHAVKLVLQFAVSTAAGTRRRRAKQDHAVHDVPALPT